MLVEGTFEGRLEERSAEEDGGRESLLGGGGEWNLAVVMVYFMLGSRVLAQLEIPAKSTDGEMGAMRQIKGRGVNSDLGNIFNKHH